MQAASPLWCDIGEVGLSPAHSEACCHPGLHENVRVAKGLVCGRLKVENPRDRDSGMLSDYLHRSNLAEHGDSVAVIEGLMGDPSEPVHIV